MSQLNGLMAELNALRDDGRMAWSEHERGWIGTPGAILTALAGDGYEECKREVTTSHRDCRPAGGVWQGVNPRTGSVAAAIWVIRSAAPEALVFIQVDGESLVRPGRGPDQEEGGQG